MMRMGVFQEFFKEIYNNSLMIQISTCKIIKDAQPLDNENLKVKHPQHDMKIDKTSAPDR